jgi:hypothetical protein
VRWRSVCGSFALWFVAAAADAPLRGQLTVAGTAALVIVWTLRMEGSQPRTPLGGPAGMCRSEGPTRDLTGAPLTWAVHTTRSCVRPSSS